MNYGHFVGARMQLSVNRVALASNKAGALPRLPVWTLRLDDGRVLYAHALSWHDASVFTDYDFEVGSAHVVVCGSVFVADYVFKPEAAPESGRVDNP